MIGNMHRLLGASLRSINPWAGEKLLDPKPTANASFKDILTHSVKTGAPSYIDGIGINVQAS